MLIIYSAANKFDDPALEDILHRFDTTDERDREGIAAELEGMIGNWVRSALLKRLGSFGLGADEIESLATEVIRKALDGAGRTRFRRTDIVPEVLVQQMQGTPHGQALWAQLQEPLQRDLANAKYIKAELAQRLVEQINGLIQFPDFADQLGLPHIPTNSDIERSYQHAKMLSEAFPGAIAPVTRPEANLLGFLSANVIPTIANRMKSERGTHSPETIRAWNAIRPVVEDIHALVGYMPTAEEVHTEYRRRLSDQYGGSIRWIEEQVRKIQPDNPFKVKDSRSLADAKRILLEHGFAKDQFEEGGKYYVPKSAVKGIGLSTIQRLMTTPGLGAPRVPSDIRFIVQPEPEDRPDIDVPQWAREMSEQGRGGDLYRAILERIYPDASSLEREIGSFLAAHPDPSQEEIDQFLHGISERYPEAETLIRRDWDHIVHAIDSAVVRSLGDGQVMSEVQRDLGLSSTQLASCRDGIRRTVFLRKTDQILRLSLRT